MKNLTAKINTKSNDRNLNGTIQHVSEIKGNRVSCKIWDETICRFITSDFVLNEVELIYTATPNRSIRRASSNTNLLTN